MACIIVHDICVVIKKSSLCLQAAAVGCNVAQTAESAGLVGCPVHPYQTFRAARHLQREEDQRMYEQMVGVDWRNNPDAQRYIREVEEEYRRAWSNMRPG